MVVLVFWGLASTLIAAAILMPDSVWSRWGLLSKCMVGAILTPGFIAVFVLSVVMERVGIWTLIEKSLELLSWYQEGERISEKGGDKSSLTPPLGRTA